MQKGLGAIGLLGFVAVALGIAYACGRFDQRVFDDEALTLAAIDGWGYVDLLRFYIGGQDVHPPLSFLWFRALADLGLPFWLQRGLSLAIAATGFALVLDLVWRRLPDDATASRLLALTLFLGAPLLYGMGAALRWYPLLVLPVAIALVSALDRGRPTMVAAIALGVAANISYLAAIPAAAYLGWRYLGARKFDAAWDVPFLLAVGVLSAPALLSFGLSALNLPAQFEGSLPQSVGTMALGVIGGYGLGLTQSVIALPFVLFCLLAAFGALLGFRRPSTGGLLSVSLLIAFLCAGLALAGFAKPRSLLFAVPFLLALVVLGGSCLPWRRGHAVATALFGLIVSAAALWLLTGNDRPFKRNLHIPDREILAAIRQHAPVADSLVVSSEPSLSLQLRELGYCVIAASLPDNCARRSAPVLVVVDDGTFTQRPGFEAATSGIAREHRLAEQFLFGDDEDAPTKQFLTGRLVPKWLVSVAIYRGEG